MSLTLRTTLIAIVAAAAQGALAVLPIKHWTTTADARVYFVPNPSIPMLDINLDVDAGSRYEPAAEMGLASLAAGMLGKGIAAQGNVPTRNEAAITDVFADADASFGGGAGDGYMSLYLRTLFDPVERDLVITLVTQIIPAPIFPDVILARDEQRLMAAIRESLTKPSMLAGHAFGKAICSMHPYGQTVAPGAVESITYDDIVRYYQTDYMARRAVVAPIGTISRQEAEAIAEQIARDLPVDDVTPPALPDVKMPLAKMETIRIPHPAQQAAIISEQPGTAYGDEDYPPLLVGNYVFDGGGFSARLTDEVHERRDLTYDIDNYFVPVVQPGPLELALQTREDQAEEALGVAHNTIIKSVADGLTDVELKVAKDNFTNGFPLRLDSDRKLLDNIANIGWYSLPLDYLDAWTQRIATVTRDQVCTAFQRVLQSQTMTTIAVGGPEKATVN